VIAIVASAARVGASEPAGKGRRAHGYFFWAGECRGSSDDPLGRAFRISFARAQRCELPNNTVPTTAPARVSGHSLKLPMPGLIKAAVRHSSRSPALRPSGGKAELAPEAPRPWLSTPPGKRMRRPRRWASFLRLAIAARFLPRAVIAMVIDTGGSYRQLEIDPLVRPIGQKRPRVLRMQRFQRFNAHSKRRRRYAYRQTSN
jgi:hypothetical protein